MSDAALLLSCAAFLFFSVLFASLAGMQQHFLFPEDARTFLALLGIIMATSLIYLISGLVAAGLG